MGAALFPSLGYGLGLRRPHHAYVCEHRPAIDWFEVISENFMATDLGWGDAGLALLEQVRETYPVVLHGVSLSLGSSDALDMEYLKRLKTLAERIEPALISDHACWTSIDQQHLHDLLPLPYTESVIQHMVERITRVQELLGRRILLENVSSYLSFSFSEMSEWEFMREIAVRADCGLLLDVNNVYVSSMNHGFDPYTYLSEIPPERVGQMHLAGHTCLDKGWVDTHDQPVAAPVWALFREAVRMFGVTSVNIERDADIPAFAELEAELESARAHAQEALHAPLFS